MRVRTEVGDCLGSIRHSMKKLELGGGGGGGVLTTGAGIDLGLDHVGDGVEASGIEAGVVEEDVGPTFDGPVPKSKSER